MTNWIDLSYTIAALTVSGLLVYVMQKVETDRTSKIDHPTVQWLRRLAFTGAALSLLYSISSVNWQITCLILVAASGVLLTINAVALSMRAPPPRKGRPHYRPHYQSSYGLSYAVSRLIHYFSHHHPR